MALKPSYDDKLHLSGLSNTEILILALEASQKLEWNIEEIAPEWLRFEVPINMHTSGEEITFTLGKEGDGEISIHSECTSIQFVDYGKNRKNIQKLRKVYDVLLEEIFSHLLQMHLTFNSTE